MLTTRSAGGRAEGHVLDGRDAADLSVLITGHTIPTDGGTGAAGGWFRTRNRPGQVWTNRPIEAD